MPYDLQAGDFNSAPSTLPMTVVLEHAGLDDAWACLHPPPEPIQAGHVDPVDAISVHGFTYGSPLDSYTVHERLDTHAQGKRLDYVLFRNPPARPSASSSPSPSPAALHQLVPTEARVVLTDPVPGQTFSYSDHFGIEATFRIEHLEPKKITHTAAPPKHLHLGREHALAVLDALQIHLTHSIARNRRELRVSLVCALFLVCELIGTAWSPKGALTPLFVFIGAGATWVGTTMFYVGLLYGRWETHALRNAIGEVGLYAQSCGSGED